MRVTGLFLVVPACIAFGACGNDETGSDDGAAAYCEAAEALNSAQTEPTPEQFDHLVAVAPEAIADDVAALVEATQTRQFPPEIESHEARLMDWEAEHCGEVHGGDQEE